MRPGWTPATKYVCVCVRIRVCVCACARALPLGVDAYSGTSMRTYTHMHMDEPSSSNSPGMRSRTLVRGLACLGVGARADINVWVCGAVRAHFSFRLDVPGCVVRMPGSVVYRCWLALRAAGVPHVQSRMAGALLLRLSVHLWIRSLTFPPWPYSHWTLGFGSHCIWHDFCAAQLSRFLVIDRLVRRARARRCSWLGRSRANSSPHHALSPCIVATGARPLRSLIFGFC